MPPRNAFSSIDDLTRCRRRWDRSPGSAFGRSSASRRSSRLTSESGSERSPNVNAPSPPGTLRGRLDTGRLAARPAAAPRRRCTSPPRPWSGWDTRGLSGPSMYGPGVPPIEAARAVGTGGHAVAAADAAVHVHHHDAVLLPLPGRLGGADLDAGRVRAVVAQHQHRLLLQGVGHVRVRLVGEGVLVVSLQIHLTSLFGSGIWGTLCARRQASVQAVRTSSRRHFWTSITMPHCLRAGRGRVAELRSKALPAAPSSGRPQPAAQRREAGFLQETRLISSIA